MPPGSPRPGGGQALDEGAVRGRAKSLLADFKVPRHFVEVEAFPVAVSPNGEKIQRGKLKEMATACLAGQTADA